MTHRDPKYLDLPRDKDIPCFLGLEGQCWGDVTMCHSDLLHDGRGAYHKSHDCLSVPGCVAHHAIFTREHLGDDYFNVHARALKRWLVWAFENGKIGVL